MLDGLKESLSSFKLKNKQSVALDIFYDSETDKIIVGYGHLEKRFGNVGIGKTLTDALKRLAEDIDDRSLESKSRARTTCRDADSIKIDIDLYHSKKEEEYIVKITDGDSAVSGQGRSVSRAFIDLSEKDVTIDGI